MADSLAGRPVRVAHLTSVHPRTDTRVFLKECRSLVQAGFEVFLIVADGRGSETREGVQIVDVGPRSGGRAGRALVTAGRVFAAARRLKADIYHFHDPELLPWGVLLRCSGGKVVYDAHEHLSDDVHAKRYLPVALRPAVSLIAGSCELLAVRALSAVVAATPYILERFRRRPALTAGVYNFPLAEELLRPRSWGARDAQACFVGGIGYDRGIRELALAATMCRSRIVVAGPLWDGLTPQSVLAIPGWDRISYRGVLGRAEVADLMGASRVGIVTFLPNVGHVNALPNKLFEYMSAGIAVVASDFPHWRDIVSARGCGLCVNPRDPAAIAAAVDRLAEDETFGAACGRNGAEAVAREYNWNTQAAKLVDLYRRL